MRLWKLVAVSSISLFGGCASFGQNEDEVYKRESGEILKPWKSVAEAAHLHWPYAWASVAAYQDSDDPKRQPLETTIECPEPHEYLLQQGWTRWSNLPTLRKIDGEPQPASDQMRHAHLRAEVWSNKEAKKVIVAFGGTAAASLEDWKANFRWLLALFNVYDAYDVLTDVFVPTFMTEYRRRSEESGSEWLKSAQIVSTGHSLGGGLAQRFAYSLTPGPGVPRVSEVYAFDPSPVSGKRSVSGFENQAKNLVIYRIYNRGETLASIRSILQMGNKANARNQGQTWIDIRYRENWSWRTLLPSGSVHAHGMYRLACFMKRHLPQPTLTDGLGLTQVAATLNTKQIQ